MNIQEAIINKVYETKFGEFCFGIKTKEGDLAPDQKEAIRAAWRMGTPLSFGQIEKYQDEEVPLVKEKKPQTIYQEFKRVCEEYSGSDYYQILKEHLGVKHLSDLEKTHSKSMVEDLLICQREYIALKLLNISNPNENVPEIISSLTHKDNAYNLWKTLFEGFNT